MLKLEQAASTSSQTRCRKIINRLEHRRRLGQKYSSLPRRASTLESARKGDSTGAVGTTAAVQSQSHYASVDWRESCKEKRPDAVVGDADAKKFSHAESIVSMSIRTFLPTRINSSMDERAENSYKVRYTDSAAVDHDMSQDANSPSQPFFLTMLP